MLRASVSPPGIGKSHEFIERRLQQCHCSTSVGAPLIADMPRSRLTPGLLLQCSVCRARRPWMLAHAGQSLSSSHPGDHAIPLLLVPPTFPSPPSPNHSQLVPLPYQTTGQRALCVPGQCIIPLLIYLLGHDLSLQRGFRNDVCVLREKNLEGSK